MKMNRSLLLSEICRIVHISRRTPNNDAFTLDELKTILSTLVTLQHRVTQLEAELDYLYRNKEP